MADITSLSALKTHLETAIQNDADPLLTPGNAGVAKLARFVSEIPGIRIPLSNVIVKWNDEQDKLILGGNTNLFWGISSWGGEGVSIHAITVEFEIISGQIGFDFTMGGSIQVGAQTIPLQGRLLENESLLFKLPGNLNEQISLTGIANLITHNRLGAYLPVDIDIFDRVALSGLEFTFGFFWPSQESSRFTSDIGLDWTIVEDKIVLKKIGVTLESSSKFNQSGNLEQSLGGDIHATLQLGEEFDIRLRLQGQYRWILEIIPKNGDILPGLSALAGLIGGSSFQNSTKTGLQRLGINELSLDYAGIGVDIYQKKLQNVIIKGHLTFYGITFLINTQLPNFELYGRLSPKTPVHLKELIGKFFSGAEAFPEIDITELGIAIHPSLDTYSLNMGIDTTWHLEIGKASIGIKRFSFQISKKGKSLTGWMLGKFNFLGAEFDLSAQHPEADGGWNIDGYNLPNQAIQFGELVKSIGDQFGTAKSLPAALTGLTIEELRVSFNTATKDFYFFCDTKFPIDQKSLEASIKIEITHNDDKYTRKFSGVVKVADLEFDLIFNQEQDADTIFLAAFENNSGKDETISPLVELITDNKEILDAANGITFNLKDALLVIDKSPAATKILFGLDIGGGLDISQLPLVGKMLPENASVRMTFQPLLTKEDFLEADLNKVRPLVPAGGFNLPQEAKERLGFNMQLMVGAQKFDLSLPIGVNDVKTQPSTASTPPTTSASAATATAAPPASTADIKWFVIQRQLGPVNFGRIGVQFQDSQLYFLLDASLSLAGLTISLDGLFVSTTLNPIHPRFGLHGLGIDYKKGPLEIGGAFLRQTITDKAGNTYDTYDGTAIIRTEKFSLAALGSYAYYQGHPSLFIYAFVDAPLGGPAFFFVTGLAAGFGYNRRVVMPTLEGVRTFPLVAQAMSGPPDTTSGLSNVINQLHEVITPATGEYFFAVGIRFTSFKIIDSFVLLTVSFGLEFEVDVLGISTLVIPTPEAGSALEPLAEVQLALRAVFNPAKGYLKVQAALTSASFILSRNCHLTGGFAFYAWFRDNPEEGAAAGDFALTIGGYHPRFKPPAHYPRVAPLGFNWQVIPELVIKGDFYFALLPSAVMAGGHLSALWTSGNLSAWFTIGADFIISWKPYFYDATMYLDMGVSYTYELFGTHQLSLDVGADLHLWGPEFSGKALVHLWIFTFEIGFGANSKQEPDKLTWEEFRKGFLPDNAKWERVSVTKGLVKKLGTEADPFFVLNPKDFMIETGSAIPFTASKQLPNDNITKINIGSMGIDDNGVLSTHDISIGFRTNEVTADFTDVTADFTFTPIKKNVPGALWGPIFKHSENETEEQRLVKNACIGFAITGKPVTASDNTHDVASEKLFAEEEPFDKGNPIAFGVPVSLKGEWLKATGVRDSMLQNMEARYGERSTLLQAMGILDEYYPNKELADEFILTTGQ